MNRNPRVSMNADLKKQLFNFVVVMTLSVLSSTTVLAAIRLPKLVGDNMVLQRDVPLKIWGWANVGELVNVDFQGQHAATKTNDKGEWAVTLSAQHAGGPFTMTIAGENTLTLNNILIGDVWLASGQSNMQFPLSGETGFGGINNADAEINSANFPEIRLFLVKQTTALQPVADVESAGWFATTPQTVKQFSAVAYLFGRELHQRYHVPIGLIDSTWGGTPAEAWMSEAAVQKFPEFHASLARKAKVDATALADYDQYLATRNAWYAEHASEDRGRVVGQDVWAAPEYDDANWPTTLVPKPWPTKVVKDFDGTLWMRKHLVIPNDQAGKRIELHLSKMLQLDTTYFNGHKIGETDGDAVSRNYDVPAEYVRAGDNVIAVRLTGQNRSGDGFVGMHGDAAEMVTQVGTQTISLSGAWLYQTGPDLSALPEPNMLAEFRAQFPQAPTLLFNAMIAPLDSFKLKGVIWYQGESNANRPVQYRTLFSGLIRDWRRAWGYQLPFLFVQLAGFGVDKAEPADYSWAELREAQAMALALPKTGMATAIDIGDVQNIHPRNKQDVGHRLALAAIKVAYGADIVFSGPTYQAMQLQGNAIRIRFSHTGSGLIIKPDSSETQGFSIAGADGKYVWAQAKLAKLNGPEVIVSNNSIQKPVAVRYNWGNTPNGNLYNKEGLPAVPFRTGQVDR